VRFLQTSLLGLLLAGAAPAQVGIQIIIGRPPVYGRYYAPRPRVYYPPPVVVYDEPPEYYYGPPPRMYGPPYGRAYGHYKNKHHREDRYEHRGRWDRD